VSLSEGPLRTTLEDAVCRRGLFGVSPSGREVLPSRIYFFLRFALSFSAAKPG